jgi:hypothetical protein
VKKRNLLRLLSAALLAVLALSLTGCPPSDPSSSDDNFAGTWVNTSTLGTTGIDADEAKFVAKDGKVSLYVIGHAMDGGGGGSDTEFHEVMRAEYGAVTETTTVTIKEINDGRLTNNGADSWENWSATNKLNNIPQKVDVTFNSSYTELTIELMGYSEKFEKQ